MYHIEQKIDMIHVHNVPLGRRNVNHTFKTYNQKKLTLVLSFFDTKSSS